MNTKENFGELTPAVSILEEIYKEERRACLLRFVMADVSMYGIYLSDRFDSSAEFFAAEPEAALALFKDICSGELSASHLADVIRDFNTEVSML